MLAVLGISLAVFVIILAADQIIYKDINRSITIETGTGIPQAADFIRNPKGDAVYVTDISKIDFNTPAVSPLEIKYNGRSYFVRLKIEDTLAPTAAVKALDLYSGQTAAAEDFVENVQDAQAVTVSFKAMPDFTRIDSQPVTIWIQDASGNRTEYQTTLRISKLVESITMEATHEALDIRSLLKKSDEAGTVVLVGEPADLSHVGDFQVRISIDDVIYDSKVSVIDTVAPAGTAVDQTFWIGSEVIQAAAFVKDVSDMTSVTENFQTPPDLTRIGEQDVTIVLTDEGQNTTTLKCTLSVRKDTTPPALYVSNKVAVYIGQAVAYKKGVYATDDRDGPLEVTVDSSKVNPKAEGDYIVTYSATDSSGNTTTKDVPVIVKKQTVTMAELEQLADGILADITTAGMTMREKAWAIYEYVNLHLTYTGTSDKTDWMKEAYRGIIQGVGDCFTYYSMSNLLLERVGFEILSVERASKPGEAHHYWHMVYCDGGWYHFDACIHKPKLVSFMLTDAQLDAYSALQGKDNYYYRYDRSKYPATPVK